MPLLETRDVIVDYSVGRNRSFRAVDGVSIHVEPGESLGLVGESGSGKTTLGHAVLGLLRPVSGMIRFEDRDIYSLRAPELKKFRRRAQMVFQDPVGSLNPRMSVGAMIEEPLLIHSLGDRRERAEKVKELLEQVGLGPDCASRYPHEFSGGQRQRIGIARALALAPALLVADEPVSALDVSVQAQIMNLLRELRQQMGLALLFIAHDLAVVRYLCSRVVVLFRGRVVESGPAEALFETPAHPYTRSLLDAAPDVERALAARALSSANVPDVAPAEAADWTGCAFHPRCPLVRPECRVRPPALVENGLGRACACWAAPQGSQGAGAFCENRKDTLIASSIRNCEV